MSWPSSVSDRVGLIYVVLSLAMALSYFLYFVVRDALKALKPSLYKGKTFPPFYKNEAVILAVFLLPLCNMLLVIWGVAALMYGGEFYKDYEYDPYDWP